LENIKEMREDGFIFEIECGCGGVECGCGGAECGCGGTECGCGGMESPFCADNSVKADEEWEIHFYSYLCLGLFSPLSNLI